MQQANEILTQASSEMGDRAKTYDSPSGERSMAKTVTMFNALTDSQITEEQGWKFMACLKLVRSEQGAFRADNFVDGAAYFALAGETASANDVDEVMAQPEPVCDLCGCWSSKLWTGICGPCGLALQESIKTAET